MGLSGGGNVAAQINVASTFTSRLDWNIDRHEPAGMGANVRIEFSNDAGIPYGYCPEAGCAGRIPLVRGTTGLAATT